MNRFVEVESIERSRLFRWVLPLLLAWVSATDLSASQYAADRHLLTSGVYTHHWNASDEHSKVWLIGLERIDSENSVYGLSYFKNSFNQPSLFFYPWGQIYRRPISTIKLDIKWGAGLLYGYVGKYQDKVPLNYKGFSPGLIVAGVWKLDKRREIQINLLGTAGLMFSLNYGL